MDYELLEILGEAWTEQTHDFFRHESGRYVIISDNNYRGFGYDLMLLCEECAAEKKVTCTHYSGEQKMLATDVPTFDEAAALARAHASKNDV